MDLVICPTKLSIIVIWFGKIYIHVTWFWFHGICTGICTFRQHRQIYFIRPSGYNYDGKSSWTDYQVHFETVSKLNQWTDEIKALKLISCMQDSALSHQVEG
jgi:hypothetical protein